MINTLPKSETEINQKIHNLKEKMKVAYQERVVQVSTIKFLQKQIQELEAQLKKIKKNNSYVS